MLGRSLSRAVQGSEGNRQNLPRVGSHAQHVFQALEDGDKPDTRAVRVAVSTMTACRGLVVKAVGRNVSGRNNGGAVGRRNVFLLFARGDWDSEPASQAGAAGRRRPTAATRRGGDGGGKRADERAHGQAGRRRRQSADAPEGLWRTGKEAAGGCSEQGKRVTSARPPPSVQRVQRGRPPTAAQPEAESAAPPQRGEHKRRGPAPHLAKPGVQPGAESGSGGLGRPRAVRVFEDKHAA